MYVWWNEPLDERLFGTQILLGAWHKRKFVKVLSLEIFILHLAWAPTWE
jgi:hypothetical protein